MRESDLEVGTVLRVVWRYLFGAVRHEGRLIDVITFSDAIMEGILGDLVC